MTHTLKDSPLQICQARTASTLNLDPFCLSPKPGTDAKTTDETKAPVFVWQPVKGRANSSQTSDWFDKCQGEEKDEIGETEAFNP